MKHVFSISTKVRYSLRIEKCFLGSAYKDQYMYLLRYVMELKPNVIFTLPNDSMVMNI